MSEANLLQITAGDHEVIDVALTGLTDAQMVGAVVKFTARWRTDSPSEVLSYSTGGGINVTPGPVLSITIQAADTAWIKQRAGLVYDVEVTPSDGSGPSTVVAGRLIVNPSVS